MKSFICHSLFIFTLILAFNFSHAQVGIEWLHSYQTGTVAYGKMATAIDDQDNVYYLINFRDTTKRQVLFNKDTLFANDKQMHLVKTNAFGHVLWSQVVDNAWGAFIEIDASGHLILAGDFDGIVDFDPDSTNSYLVKSDTIGDDAEFLLKLDANANFKWVNCIGGFALQGRSLAVGPNNEIAWGGMFYGTVDFDPTPAYDVRSGNLFDMYLQKVDANGTVQFTYTYVSSGYNFVHDLTFTTKGALYAVGVCDNIDFDPSASTSPTQNSASFFVKYDTSGAYDWVKYLNVVPTAISIDPSTDDIYIGGNFLNTSDFDPGPGVQNFTSHGGTDAFALRLDSNANFIWARTVGGLGNEIVQAMDYRNSHLTLGIAYENTVTVNTAGVSPTFTSNGAKDLLVVTYDSSQAMVTADSYGSSGIDAFHSIRIKNAQTYYFSGTYENMIFFQPFASLDAGTPYNRSNFFIAEANRFTIGLDRTSGSKISHEVYPNPSSGQMEIRGIENTNLVIYNSLGQAIEQHLLLRERQSIDLSHLEKGLYFFHFSSGSSEKSIQKVVLID